MGTSTYTYNQNHWHGMPKLIDWIRKKIPGKQLAKVSYSVGGAGASWNKIAIEFWEALSTDEESQLAAFLAGGKPTEYIYQRYDPAQDVLISEITAAVGKTPVSASVNEVVFDTQLTTAEKQALLNYVKSDLKKFEEVVR